MVVDFSVEVFLVAASPVGEESLEEEEPVEIGKIFKNLENPKEGSFFNLILRVFKN